MQDLIIEPGMNVSLPALCSVCNDEDICLQSHLIVQLIRKNLTKRADRAAVLPFLRVWCFDMYSFILSDSLALSLCVYVFMCVCVCPDNSVVTVHLSHRAFDTGRHIRDGDVSHCLM